MKSIEKSTIEYIEELRKVRNLPKKEKLKHMLKFMKIQNELNNFRFSPIGHSTGLEITHNTTEHDVIVIIKPNEIRLKIN